MVMLNSLELYDLWTKPLHLHRQLVLASLGPCHEVVGSFLCPSLVFGPCRRESGELIATNVVTVHPERRSIAIALKVI